MFNVYVISSMLIEIWTQKQNKQDIKIVFENWISKCVVIPLKAHPKLVHMTGALGNGIQNAASDFAFQSQMFGVSKRNCIYFSPSTSRLSMKSPIFFATTFRSTCSDQKLNGQRSSKKLGKLDCNLLKILTNRREPRQKKNSFRFADFPLCKHRVIKPIVLCSNIPGVQLTHQRL